MLWFLEDSDKVRVDAFSQTDTKLENCQLMSKQSLEASGPGVGVVVVVVIV